MRYKFRVKLLIIEDEKILLEKYIEYLSHFFSEVVGCSTITSAKDAINSNNFNIALVDHNLPDGNGLEFIKNLSTTTSANEGPVFIMITAYSKEKLAIESLNLGVFRYIEKPVQKEKLVDVMKAACEEAQKRSTFQTLSAQFTLSQSAKDKLVADYFMSKRELEVLESILINNKNKLTAQHLNISQGTVRNHLSNIFQKLNINNKDELKEEIQKLNTNEPHSALK